MTLISHPLVRKLATLVPDVFLDNVTTTVQNLMTVATGMSIFLFMSMTVSFFAMI